MNFPKKIKNIRRQNFLTQKDFAKELGVSFATVNRWETGKTTPSIKKMQLIDEFCQKRSINFNVVDEVSSDT